MGTRLLAEHAGYGPLTLAAKAGGRFLFCDNETNAQRLFGVPGRSAFPKDGIGDHVVHGAPTVNPEGHGSKAAAHHIITVPAGQRRELRLRLVRGDVPDADLAAGFDAVVRARQAEADEFFAALAPAGATAESTTGLFGGNSNWRGPIWFPVNYLVIEALHRYARFFGDDVLIEHPAGSGRKVTLTVLADDLARRLVSVFLDDERGRRPVFGDIDLFQTHPDWHDLLPFHEYFHGDTGRGVGASHQTGWTALVANLVMRTVGRGATGNRQE